MINYFVSIFAQLAPNLYAWVQSSKYVLLFLGSIFEGPVIMMASGFLYRLGGFELVPMYLVLVSGDFVADLGWYTLGRYGGRPLMLRWGEKFGITDVSIEKIQGKFNKYHDKILIISKLTMGFGFAVVILAVAGMSRVPFKKYLTLNLFGGFIWTSLLLIAGYFFGNIYASITGPEKIVFVIGVLVLFISGFKIANKYFISKNI